MAEKVIQLNPKEQVRRENEQHKDMDTAQQRCDKVEAAAKALAQAACQVIKAQLENKLEGTENGRQIIGEKALTDAVRSLELIADAMKQLKSVENDVLTRLLASWEFNKRDVRQVVKERRHPKAQFELELNLNRSLIDGYHSTIEKNGLARTDKEKNNNGRTSKAA